MKDLRIHCVVLCVSIANISSILQNALMFDISFITNQVDTKILKGCLLLSLIQTIGTIGCEYTLVGSTHSTSNSKSRVNGGERGGDGHGFKLRINGINFKDNLANIFSDVHWGCTSLD